jgi:hypothetical protein
MKNPDDFYDQLTKHQWIILVDSHATAILKLITCNKFKKLAKQVEREAEIDDLGRVLFLLIYVLRDQSCQR